MRRSPETDTAAWRERCIANRQAICQKAAEAGVELACRLYDSKVPGEAELAAGISLGEPEAWWPELAPLSKPERALVRREVANAFAKWMAANAPTPAGDEKVTMEEAAAVAKEVEPACGRARSPRR